MSMNFDGTAVAMGVIVSGDSEWFKVIVDGDLFSAQKIEVASRSRWQAVILAQGLSAGAHHVEVVKETNNNGHMTFLGFAGIDGAGILPPPVARTKRIAYYGDSCVAGLSVESETDQGARVYQGCTNSWAGITSRRFDADYQNCSISGARIQDVNRWFDRIDPDAANTPWDFSRWVPDVVVLNAGSNNTYQSETTIRRMYNDLLDDFRAVYPNAHIVLANADGWSLKEPAAYTQDVVNLRNDPNMSTVIFPWQLDEWHGCESDHGGMADYVSEHIATVMNWTRAPSDIMIGFGRGGNVANGSFEESAPFGGFGWRYGVNNPKVQRTYSPSTAQDGDYYAAVANGGAIQQQNPARDGQTVTISMWLRSPLATGSAAADVTIDFRKGKQSTTPLQTSTATVALSTNWIQHTFTAVAPTLATPVWYTRLTVTAPGQSQVEIDNIVMTVN